MRPRELTYARLKRRILLNELEPHAVLTELGLAQEMGCSQGTVREALLRLQGDGLVFRDGFRGTTVTPLDREVADEMLALRRRLETRAAPRAVAAMTPLMLARLRDIERRMEEAAQAGDEYALIELDTDFHMALFRLAGFKALEQILLRAILHSHRQKLWEPRHRRTLVLTATRHIPLIESIALGPEALAAALEEHIDTIVDVEAMPDQARAAS